MYCWAYCHKPTLYTRRGASPPALWSASQNNVGTHGSSHTHGSTLCLPSRSPIVFDRVSCHVRGLEAAGRTANSYGDCLVPILLERLPATTRQQLTRDHGTTEWEIGALLAALRKEIEILELGPSLDDATPQPTMNFATMARRGQRQGSASRSSRTPRCAFCDRPHPSSQCSTVTDPTAAPRHREVQRPLL